MSGQLPYLLYADDDPDDIELLKLNLVGVDPTLQLLAVQSGMAAYEALERLTIGARLPSAIILDYNMPGWNGLTTLQAIKSSPTYARVPVYIFTTSDHPRLRVESVEKGAVDLLTKPFGSKDLQQTGRRFSKHLLDTPLIKI